MAFIPNDARWYLADIVLESTIEGDSRNLVDINTCLVEADSPDQAYEKAVALGRDSELEFLNTDGKQVRVMFRGLQELGVIHDDLEHGAELQYRRSVNVPEGQLREWILPREALGVFKPRQPNWGYPNTMSEEVMQMLEAEGFDRSNLDHPK